MVAPPVVTGLSPKEGPPGTRVIIRGEFLGFKANDLIGLTICGCDCLLSAEWKSKNKIVARSGPGKGEGDIIVTTRSGGRGTCTVQFKGYYESYGPMKESAVWVEEGGTNLTWGRRPLSPASYAPPDPLGLSTEGDENKFPEDELHDLFPDSSGDLSAENFHPGWFLLEHHHATTFEDLKAGTLFLKRKVDVQKEGQLSFLKANTSSVMDQLDVLILLKDRFEMDNRENGKESLNKLETAIEQSIKEANKLFDEVLSRKDNADSTRSALSIMTRYKFLFQLPGNIDKNIKKKEYDLVINDYARAKNLFGKTDVLIFKTVLQEVEKRISNLCIILHTKLQKMPVTVEEQKHLIHSLVNLEWAGDAAWDAIVSRSDYIVKQIIRARDYHVQLEASEEDQGKNIKATKGAGTATEWWPPRVSLCGTLCPLLTELLPDLWRLGQSYFCGELHGDRQSEKQSKFKTMVLTSIDLFCTTIRNALLPHSLEKLTTYEKSVWNNQNAPNLCNWLTHCLRDVRETYSSLMRFDLPSEALDIICSLIHDLRLHCMVGLLKQSIDGIKTFNKKETWKIEFDPQHGGVTELPDLLEKTICDVMKVIKETVLASCPREKQLFDTGSPAQKYLNAHIQDMFTVYVKCLEKLAFSHDEQDSGQSPLSVVLGSPNLMVFNSRLSDDTHDGLPVSPPWQYCLLITLSNCRYTSDCVLPRVLMFFEKNGYNKPILPVETAKVSLRTLDKAIMEAYLEQKSDPLVGTIEPSMYVGKFEWNTKIKPSDVRPYMKECINNLIAVHAEIHSISPSLVKAVLTQIVETVAEEIVRLMSGCNGKFSPYGAIQAHVDVEVLKEAVSTFMTPRVKTLFDEAFDCIPELKSKEDKVLKEDIVREFQRRTSLQLICLKHV